MRWNCSISLSFCRCLLRRNRPVYQKDEVEINGVTWTRFIASHGATYLYAEASNGTTVSIYANSNLTWEDALPMFEMVTLK